MALFGSRRFLARELGSLDDLPAREERVPEGFQTLEGLILDERDRLLLDALASIHEQRCHEPIAVAVVYGAQHMRAVVHSLSARFGYRPVGADWSALRTSSDNVPACANDSGLIGRARIAWVP
jgi:hypothetical protein